MAQTDSIYLGKITAGRREKGLPHRLASSPSQALTRQIPPFVAVRHLPPERGKSFLKGRAFGSPRKLYLFAKASPFGRAGALAPERARTLTMCGAPLFYLPAVILPKYMLSVCAMCTNKKANGCFLVDKSQK